jgi:iron complex transport system ATP-binding protein
LRDVSVRLRPGRLTGILGCNGAGKSTLLRTLLGYLAPTRGSVNLDGRSLREWPDWERAARVAYIAQDHYVQWPMQVEHVVALGRMPHGYGRGIGLGELSDADRRATEGAMAAAGVSHLAGRTVDTLSSGERARVLLARALAVEPAVLLADEPLAGLDPAYQLHVSALLQQQAHAGKTVALVLHDLGIAARHCDELVLLHEGRVLAAGAPVTVLSDENLHIGFGIEALRFEHDGKQCLIPWNMRADRGVANDTRSR